MNAEDTEALLARIDERTENLLTKVGLMEKKLERQYVTKAEFWPVRAIVYSGAGITLISVVGALIGVVITK